MNDVGRFDPTNLSGHYWPSPERVRHEAADAINNANAPALFFIDLCARIIETHASRMSKLPAHLRSHGEVDELMALRMGMTPHWKDGKGTAR